MKQIYLLIILIFVSIGVAQTQTVDKLVVKNNEFAFVLFADICVTDTSNVFVSPISISTALAMTYEGAKGKTAKEMRNVLGFAKNRNESHKDYIDLLSHYSNLKESVFTMANAVVAQNDYDFLESYFSLINDYNAKISTANFKDYQDREKARNDINQWVLDNTNDKIEELLDESSLSALTRLVLLNAIHFKAKWKYEFSEERTRQMIFFHPNRQYIASFMHNRQDYNFYKNNNALIIEIPYKDNVASMLIIMPSDSTNIKDYLATFTYEQFLDLEKQCTVQKIDLMMPKFKIEAKYKLKKTLRNLGMISAFNGKANFKRMNGRRNLMIDEVIHQSFIEVDEEGTEAAAATAVVVREKSGVAPIYVNLNRPFIFVIKDNTKESILFVGKFMNP